MHVKREMSISSVNNVSDSIKRLAISHDGHPERSQVQASTDVLKISMPDLIHEPIITVMSSAQDDFKSKYDIIREIGKGGFSTVWLCKNKQSGVDYAVKIIDLRPLRLRERFNPMRLKREIEIMRKLKHPNIVQFVEVYEDADHLMMVLEYCPGTELFDVILARKFFTEDDARPIFAQVSQAIFYIHSLNIIHRDVKPENILIMKSTNPSSNVPVAKLLDFGLSKNAGVGGSAAKTFVGTPCYLAPEVEYTSKGLGTTYGLPADCWSLGAVLYVMLVARFPEFEKDFAGKVVVKLPAVLWDHVSPEAKDLVRGLMNTNPKARYTMSNVLKHPWLGRYQMSHSAVEALSLSTYYLNRALQEDETRMDEEETRRQTAPPTVEINASGSEVFNQQAMVLRTNNHSAANSNRAGNVQHMDDSNPDQLPLAPLLHLQRSIAICFEEAHDAYHEFPEVASQVRKGAALCREQLTSSTKMLRQVEQTAGSVLELFPDLELALEEGEPQLAADFFTMVKDWVAELSDLVHSTQAANKASMDQIQEIVEKSTSGLQAQSRKKSASTITMPKRMLGAILQNLKIGETQLQIDNGEGAASHEEENIELDANQMLELFMSLFGVQAQPGSATPGIDLVNRQNSNNSNASNDNRVYSIDSDASADLERRNTLSPPMMEVSSGGNTVIKPIARKAGDESGHSPSNYSQTPPHSHVGGGTVDISHMQSDASTISVSSSMADSGDMGEDFAGHVQRNSMHVFLNNQANKQKQQTPQKQSTNAAPPRPMITNGSPMMGGAVQQLAAGAMSPSPKAANKLAEALQKLRQVDVILEQLSVFWANTEVVLDLLTKKGRHVEQFIGFATKPKLMARFKERIEEYKRFWEGVSIMSNNYITGVGAQQSQQLSGASSTASPDGRHSQSPQQQLYGFLEKSSVSGKFNNGQDFVFSAATPPNSASKLDSSFDSMNGIFSTVQSVDKHTRQ